MLLFIFKCVVIYFVCRVISYYGFKMLHRWEQKKK